jgi:hypothetical protein
MISERRAVAAAGLVFFLGTGRCGGYTPGIEVAVALQAPAPTLGFDTDLGFRVHLDEAVLQVASVRLLACAPTLTERAQAALTSLAYAHHVDLSPDQAEGGAPLDLLHANGAPMAVATLRPPPGRYCHAELVLGPTEAAPEAAAVRLSGATADGIALRYLAPAALRFVLPVAPALALSDAQRQAELTILVDPRRWLDGQALSSGRALDPATFHTQLARSLRLRSQEVSFDAH